MGFAGNWKIVDPLLVYLRIVNCKALECYWVSPDKIVRGDTLAMEIGPTPTLTSNLA